MTARKGRPAIGSSQQAASSPQGSSRQGSSRQDSRGATQGSGSGRDGRTLPDFTRPALAPSLLAAVVLLACVAFLDSSAFVFARWGVTVLALIVLVFAIRGRAWWAAVLTAAVAVCWNPVVVLPIPGQLWAALQLVAAALFIVVGIAVKVPRAAD
ncbi:MULTISPECIES: DUF6804 family protein [unclassified Curtobacterium]|uniref:DUF6804 family protein n=1 Tax=unclassified Curtobacterium TaxID=257496 RepID=UPI0015E8E76C|nr:MULTISPECIES: DUF6804 family protein [unclassified Curtobacterium]WIB12679.1 hypothetical protein DEJ36_00620 [Curtobacterium sp. MCPF17_052]